MSNTYTLSQFSSICEMLPLEALQIVSKDNWFNSPSKADITHFVNFEIKNNSIKFIDISNVPKDSFIEIDKTLDNQNITIDSELNINQLASIVFSVNGNNFAFIMVRDFLTKLKKDEPEKYYECIISKRMQIFCSHLAYIRSNLTQNTFTIPDWLLLDPLFEEEIRIWNKIHPHSTFSIMSIPSFDKGSRLFTSIFYYCFLMVFNKYNGCEIDKTQKIQDSIRFDLEKCRSVISLI